MFINNTYWHAQILPYESKVSQQNKLAYVGIFVSESNVNPVLDIIKDILDRETWAYLDCVHGIAPRRDEILNRLNEEEGLLLFDPNSLPQGIRFKNKVKKGYAGLIINTLYNSDFFSFAGVTSIIPSLYSNQNFKVFCADFRASNSAQAMGYLGYSKFHYILTLDEKMELLNQLEALIDNRIEMSRQYRAMAIPTDSIKEEFEAFRNYMLSDELVLFNP